MPVLCARCIVVTRLVAHEWALESGAPPHGGCFPLWGVFRYIIGHTIVTL